MHTPLQILIVENDPVTVLAIEDSLIEAGYTICGKASDYESAINIMKRESPDLALIDIHLDGQPDGILTAQELIRIKPIPVIYLTGHHKDATFERAKKTNPVAFLYKPFRIREVAMQIDLALHNHYEGNNADLLSTPGYIYVPDGHGKSRVHQDSIIYIKADRAYMELFLVAEEARRLKPDKSSNSFVISVSLGKILDYLPDNFYKISRSIAINLNHLDRIETNRVILGPHELSLPEGAHPKLIDRINVIRSRKRH